MVRVQESIGVVGGDKKVPHGFNRKASTASRAMRSCYLRLTITPSLEMFGVRARGPDVLFLMPWWALEAGP